jgi:predicted Holliday junction resolvase-like endonuclease
MEGVMERTDIIGQLQSQVKQQEEQIKKLKGDMQTREREVYHAKQRAELEKFKSDLDKTSTQSKSAGKLFEKRLDDALGQVKSEVREVVAQAKKDNSTSKSK